MNILDDLLNPYLIDGIKAIPQTNDPFDANSLWQVVQTTRGTNGQLINGGDFLKLGKTYIKVTKV